eukprot:CAMPEP_0197715630 /NCGR_PEP_ID=MMETSP1434-20131217/753_1 /TAXON_ID=265543 /ORGANISM="Minutocellus polymorphus, Strain CCMP3303" /LENGTH=348 /DNA_ID=CAMNT_0043299803 /DNA_START=45 /DNA_END=1091 /DNA_ORIENTATION=+
MKCILIPKHGEDIDNLLTFSDNFPQPARKPGQVLVKVQACALAPGDIRVMKGHCDYFQSPRGFPYIPGGDISGIVQEADEKSRFKRGDRVLCMFEIPRPLDGLAEYACVKEHLVEKIPDDMSFTDAAALTSSALASHNACESFVKPGDRVLILGGSGGCGTFLIQMAKNKGASYIATTSSDSELVKSLGADECINYHKEKFWQITKFKEDPFDIIIDLGVGRYEAYSMAKNSGVLKAGKDGGRYLTFSGDEPHMKIHNMGQTVKFALSILPRVFWTRLWPLVPRYLHHMDALEVKPGRFAKIIDMKLRVVIDPHSTDNTLDLGGVKRAFHVMDKRAGHGKVVVQVAST